MFFIRRACLTFPANASTRQSIALLRHSRPTGRRNPPERSACVRPVVWLNPSGPSGHSPCRGGKAPRAASPPREAARASGRICGFLQKRILRSCIYRGVACIILYQRRGLSIGVALSSAELQKRPRRPRPCDEPNAVGAKSLPERSVCRRWCSLALRAGNGPLRLRSAACKEGGAGGAALGPRHVIATREG